MIEDADVSEAIMCLAQMTMYAPSYNVTVEPFADAHRRSCQVLARLQEQGIEEAAKGDWRDLLGQHDH